MTESEWLVCDKPREMLRFLLGTTDPRIIDVDAFPDCKVSAWNDGCVGKLAAAIHDRTNLTTERMSILADALEDAGSTDEDALRHCRAHQLHARGCWLVDSLRGKE